MPFRDIADPEKLAMLTAVLNDICDEAGMGPGQRRARGSGISGHALLLGWLYHRRPVEGGA